MNNVFKSLNQMYYLIYTLIILFTITSYFLNLNFVVDVEMSEMTQYSLLGIHMFLTFMAFASFVYLLLYVNKSNSVQPLLVRRSKYLQIAKVRLSLIGLSLMLGVVLLYLIRSEIVLYSIAVSGLLLLFSKPNEARINDFLSE